MCRTAITLPCYCSYFARVMWEVMFASHVETSRLRYKSKQAFKSLNLTKWPLVHKRTIPTERPPLVDEI
jgi:hypothetical protein